MSSWLDNTIKINNRTTHYQRTGGDKPPLLLVHGYTDSGACWTELARELEADFDVIMPDAIGHGQSDRVGQAKISLGGLALDLVTLTEELGLVKPLALGHSMGASTVALAAVHAPTLFSAIALEDPPWRMDPHAEAADAQEMGRRYYQWLMDLRQNPVADVIAQTQTEHPTWTHTDVETYVASRRDFDMELFGEMDWAAIYHWREIVSQIQCPMLLLTADPEREAIVTPEVSQTVLDLAPKAQVAYFKGGSHHICHDQFDAYTRVLRPFLTKHSAP